MKRFLQIAGALYVSFAILTAHFALAPIETTLASSADHRSEVVTSGPTLLDSQRVDFTNTRTVNGHEKDYVIEAWTASWCGPCRTWKRKELPALLKAGYKVVVRDIDTEKPPKGVKIKSVPTICIYYKGQVLDARTYWKAKDILKYLDGRMSLKK